MPDTAAIWPHFECKNCENTADFFRAFEQRRKLENSPPTGKDLLWTPQVMRAAWARRVDNNSWDKLVLTVSSLSDVFNYAFLVPQQFFFAGFYENIFFHILIIKSRYESERFNVEPTKLKTSFKFPRIYCKTRVSHNMDSSSWAAVVVSISLLFMAPKYFQANCAKFCVDNISNESQNIFR